MNTLIVVMISYYRRGEILRQQKPSNPYENSRKKTLPGIHGLRQEFIVDIPCFIVLLFYVDVTSLDAPGWRPVKQGLSYEDQENHMPNIATVLKEEISRLARKEARKETNALRRASVQYRKDIAEMKRRISELQRKIGPLEKQVQKNIPSQAPEPDGQRARFTAKGLRSQRARLGLSAEDYGKLIGVTDQTIYNWEHESARPRKQQVAMIASLRHMGKREARARLEQLAG